MKKNLSCLWLFFLVILYSVNTNAQMTIGGKKVPESFAVLELLNKGGLRLPQMTTAERNAFTVKNNVQGNGLTIYNKTTNCVEYWNSGRWVSLCEGSSQTSILPVPCTSVKPDGTGCDQTYTVTDPDCPSGPYNISLVVGGDYASLANVDESNGSFKINFTDNSSVNSRTVLVRVTSTCTNLYKEFLFSQDGVDCTAMNYTVPPISPATANLSLCAGGSIYLSVPPATANLDKLIWTRNGIEVARGVSYLTVNQKGKYNVSMGAVGCNTNQGSERIVTESSTAAPGMVAISVSNNGAICGNNSVTLSAMGNPANVVWYHNGIQEKTGATAVVSGTTAVGEWFAAINNGGCISKPSNSIQVTRNAAAGQVTLSNNDALVNGKPLNTFTAFCSGGTLDLSVANQAPGTTYTWYNGNDAITTFPYTIPGGQTSILLRLVASDNTGALCSAEINSTEKAIITASTPVQPSITGNNTLCDGTTELTLVPQTAGNYTYTWYKDNVKMTETTQMITVRTPGSVYNGTVTNATGCVSPMAVKVINENISSQPKLSWGSKPATATFGSTVTVQTTIEFGPATKYTWTATNGATINGSGASVAIVMPASGAEGVGVEIAVTAENICGKSEPLKTTITVNSDCLAAVITEQGALAQTINLGASADARISVSKAVSTTYQWYTNSSNSASGGTAATGTGNTSATYPFTPSKGGTYYLYCVVSNCAAKLTSTSKVFVITVNADPGTLTPGSGTFGGKTCFDIAESNDNSSCGLLSGRNADRANFNLSSINTQGYTFKISGTVSNVRFQYKESLSGTIVQSVSSTVDPAAKNVSGTVWATVIYKASLSSPTNAPRTGTAYGKTGTGALTLDLYAVYNDKADGSGNDLALKLTAQIKDCACCGAMISPTQFKVFMCQNLGVDPNVDPFKPSPAIIGDKYRYGLKTPAATVQNGPVAGQYDANSYIYGGLLTTYYSGNYKTATDPCPTGFRVPTSDEWKGVIANNTRTMVGTVTPGGNQTGTVNLAGSKFGEALYLPLAGARNGLGGLFNVNASAFYLSTDAVLYTAVPGITDFYTWYYSQVGTAAPTVEKGVNNSGIQAYAMSIRCIAQ
jgi:hypothetical protein